MRICLYGLPCAGKTTLMNRIDGIRKISGGELLQKLSKKELRKEFRDASAEEKDQLRRGLAERLKGFSDFLTDGHYAFGNSPVFTNEDAEAYDVFCYLYSDPALIRERMLASDKNRRFAGYDLASWQSVEIEKLREACHRHGRDFYVISDGGEHFAEFISALRCGFSSMRYGLRVAEEVYGYLAANEKDSFHAVLADGDKTLSETDTEYQFSMFRTKVFDGDFYTGYQTWLHAKERTEYPYETGQIVLRKDILDAVKAGGAVISSGDPRIWTDLGKRYGFHVYVGDEISADAKYFAAKRLQELGGMITAYGDTMSDYYMLKEADIGILVSNKGRISGSLDGRDLHGLYRMETERTGGEKYGTDS